MRKIVRGTIPSNQEMSVIRYQQLRMYLRTRLFHFYVEKKDSDLLCQCRYQLATVNEKIIDPACDNLQVGEVSFSLPLKKEKKLHFSFLSFSRSNNYTIYSSFLGNLPRSCRQRLSISPRRTEWRNLCYNRFSS